MCRQQQFRWAVDRFAAARALYSGSTGRAAAQPAPPLVPPRGISMRTVTAGGVDRGSMNPPVFLHTEIKEAESLLFSCTHRSRKQNRSCFSAHTPVAGERTDMRFPAGANETRFPPAEDRLRELQRGFVVNPLILTGHAASLTPY